MISRVLSSMYVYFCATSAYIHEHVLSQIVQADISLFS